MSLLREFKKSGLLSSTLSHNISVSKILDYYKV